MIRGISFQIPQRSANTLWKIFGNTLAETFVWRVIRAQTEVWNENRECELFQKEYYASEDFLELIHREHFVVFLKIQAYDHTDTVNIESYEAFMQSDCQMVMLVYDCEYVEIYSKRKDVIDGIYQNISANGYKNIEYITDTNDRRTTMNVL